jgi:hypothetical protein
VPTLQSILQRRALPKRLVAYMFSETVIESISEKLCSTSAEGLEIYVLSVISDS